MQSTRPLLVTAVLALALLTAGCTSALDSGESTELENMTVEELQTETGETMANVETATFTMEMNMTVSGRNVVLDGDGAMDVENERMRLVSETEMFGEPVEITQYLVGDTMYMKSQGQWQQQQLSGPAVWDQNQLQQQQQFVENADVEVVDTRTYDGREVYVLDVTADEETLQDVLNQPGTSERFEDVFEDVEIQNMEATQYIDTESHHVRYFEMDLEMTVQGETVLVQMTMSYDNFGDPVDIELPAEAEDAPQTVPAQ